MEAPVRVRSHAKLNLTLDVTGIKDGYHLLDSFVASVSLADDIALRPRADEKIVLTMHGEGCEGIPPAGNAALRAAERFRQKYGTRGAEIEIEKHIPVGAGLGGSSADAAGVLRGMSALYGIKDGAGMKELADGLGSDTGYMLGGGYARMTGRGEIVEPVAGNAVLWFLLLCPPSPVLTAACYGEYDREHAAGGVRRETENCLRAFQKGDLAAMGRHFHNALFAPACRLNPAVKRAAEEAAALSPLGYGMTGSGSAVFALFGTGEEAERARGRYRGACRALTVCTLPAGEGAQAPEEN